MHRRIHLWAMIITVLLLALARSSAQAILEPPFGLHWGDSPEKLIVWASRHDLDVTIALPADQPSLRILKIEARHRSLPERKAAPLEGRLLTGKLYEPTVQ